MTGYSGGKCFHRTRSPLAPPVELDWEDPWVICYTGGTTGLPKGAILHYRSITANSVNTIVSWGLRPDDVIPQYMPFFHTGGLNCLTLPLVHLGGTSIICVGFDIDQLCDQIENLGVTFFFGGRGSLLLGRCRSSGAGRQQDGQWHCNQCPSYLIHGVLSFFLLTSVLTLEEVVHRSPLSLLLCRRLSQPAGSRPELRCYLSV